MTTHCNKKTVLYLEAIKMEELDTHIEDLIVTYLSEGLDPKSLEDLQNWVSASPKNKEYFVKKQEIWFSSICVKEESMYDKEEAFTKFQNRVKNSEQAKSIEKEEKPVINIYKILYRAAVVSFFLAISYISYWQGSRGGKGNLANIMIVEAPLGSKTKLYLPDGTLVWLNAGSKISYFQDFGIVSRDVELIGEAYFEVTKNKKVPFNVKSKELNVQVLGTKFDFRNYPDDKEVLVALLEGKVSFVDPLKKNPVKYLSPDQKVVFDKQTGNAVISRIKAINASGWTNGFLFFDEELLSDMTKELERSYNVEIEITNESLKGYRFYGNFIQREQSIQEIMEILASTGKIHYRIKDKDHIVIY